MEWIIGNAFSMCLFFTYGSFFLSHALSLIPWFGVGVQYSLEGNNLEGMETPAYFATLGKPISLPSPLSITMLTRLNFEIQSGFYQLAVAMLTAVFTVCAIRTNLVFFCALFILTFALACSAGSAWNIALGNLKTGQNLNKVCPDELSSSRLWLS